MSNQNAAVKFAKRVIAKLKDGDEGKLIKFHEAAIKFANKQIKANNEVIADLKERKEEALDLLNEKVENVDLGAISSLDGRKRYVDTYFTTLFSQMKATDSIDQKIEDANQEIENWGKAIDLIKINTDA